MSGKNEMKQHIKKGMKAMKSVLKKRFEEKPLHHEETFLFRRKETMVCEDFDEMLNEMIGEWEEEVRDHNVNRDIPVDLTIECSLQHDVCDSKGMALEWEVTVEWEIVCENPFQ